MSFPSLKDQQPPLVVTTDIIDSSVSETSVGMADGLEEKNGPPCSIVEGHLNNSEVLAYLFSL